jgi:flagellar protein FlaG
MTVERVSSSSFFSYESIREEQTGPKDEVSAAKPQEVSAFSPSQPPLSKEKLEEVVNGLNEFLQPSHTSVKFALHDELNEYYVQVIDEKTNEVIREIPPKKLLDVYAAMMEFVGLLVDRKI